MYCIDIRTIPLPHYDDNMTPNINIDTSKYYNNNNNIEMIIPPIRSRFYKSNKLINISNLNNFQNNSNYDKYNNKLQNGQNS